MPRAAKRPASTNRFVSRIIAHNPGWSIKIDVDWANLPMIIAQQAYAELKGATEKAGAILNARATAAGDKKWVCFMAGKPNCCPKGIVHEQLPRSTDYSRTDPKTGLMTPVYLCSENCHIRYQGQLVDERREKYAPKRGE